MEEVTQGLDEDPQASTAQPTGHWTGQLLSPPSSQRLGSEPPEGPCQAGTQSR